MLNASRALSDRTLHQIRGEPADALDTISFSKMMMKDLDNFTDARRSQAAKREPKPSAS